MGGVIGKRELAAATVYDPVLHRHRATCPECGYVAVRAKSEAAEHLLVQHLGYVHEIEVKR